MHSDPEMRSTGSLPVVGPLGDIEESGIPGVTIPSAEPPLSTPDPKVATSPARVELSGRSPGSSSRTSWP